MSEDIPYRCAFCQNEWDEEPISPENSPRGSPPKCPECNSRATSPKAYNPY